jgi:hypothetical protein
MVQGVGDHGEGIRPRNRKVQTEKPTPYHVMTTTSALDAVEGFTMMAVTTRRSSPRATRNVDEMSNFLST